MASTRKTFFKGRGMNVFAARIALLVALVCSVFPSFAQNLPDTTVYMCAGSRREVAGVICMKDTSFVANNRRYFIVADTTREDTVVCLKRGQSYQVSGRPATFVIGAPGVYHDTNVFIKQLSRESGTGCFQIRTWTIHKIFDTLIRRNVCYGMDSLPFFYGYDSLVFKDGVNHFHFTNSIGCDSVISMMLI